MPIGSGGLLKAGYNVTWRNDKGEEVTVFGWRTEDMEKPPSSGGGSAKRYNTDKPQLSLVPREAQEQEAFVWAFGAKKYGRDNWRKLWGEDTVNVCVDSAMRHLLAIQSGEVYDSESDLPHAAHVRCNMAMILEHYKKTR